MALDELHDRKLRGIYGTLAAARNRWIRVVNTILQVIELVPFLEEGDRLRILNPLRSAETTADRRVFSDSK